jgi:hypothetical protein
MCQAPRVSRQDWADYASPPPEPVTRVTLMAEYTAPPLWTDSGPRTPEALGLSSGLSAQIRAWADEWEFGGRKDSSEEEFVARGEALVALIQRELGPGVEVDYQP